MVTLLLPYIVRMGNMRLKPEIKYQSISLTIPFIQEIKNHIENDSRFSSVADYTRQAIREKMQRDKSILLEKLIEENLMLQEKYYSQLSPEDQMKMQDKWNKDFLESTKEHGSEWQVKDLKKRMKKTYRTEKKEIPDWLSDEKKFTAFVENIVAKRLEKKDKKVS